MPANCRSRSPWPSVSKSTRMSFAGFLQPSPSACRCVCGPSWLTFLGHAKDSLHSIDLFRCESVALRTYWVLVVMDQYTRRIIGFGVHTRHRGWARQCVGCSIERFDGNHDPKYLSSDHDPLYRFHQWQANLRVLDVTEIKTVPYVPMSRPFVERLIGTIRREYLESHLFWTAIELESKLSEFRDYTTGIEPTRLRWQDTGDHWESESAPVPRNRMVGVDIVVGSFHTPIGCMISEFAMHSSLQSVTSSLELGTGHSRPQRPKRRNPNQATLHSQGSSRCSDFNTRRPASRIQPRKDCRVRTQVQDRLDLIFAGDSYLPGSGVGVRELSRPISRSAPTVRHSSHHVLPGEPGILRTKGGQASGGRNQRWRHCPARAGEGWKLT